LYKVGALTRHIIKERAQIYVGSAALGYMIGPSVGGVMWRERIPIRIWDSTHFLVL